MPIYRYHFFDSVDHFVTTKIVDCETDAEAQETGDSLLASWLFRRRDLGLRTPSVPRAKDRHVDDCSGVTQPRRLGTAS